MEDRTGRGPSASSYPKLIEFFEGIIANPHASMRVRLTAAQRLDDLLARQERREDLEARRAERMRLQAAQAQREALERERENQAMAAELASQEVVEQARRHMGKILQKSL